MATTKTTQTFNLSTADLEAAVKEWIETHHGKGNALTVSVKVETRTTGYGMAEQDEHVASVSASREV